MILNFATKFPKNLGETLGGNPTFFPEKIWQGIQSQEVDQYFRNFLFSDHCKDPNLSQKPKLHTIRQGNRWKVGDKIHFYVGSRTKKALQFAPVLQVKAVDTIQIQYVPFVILIVTVNGRVFYFRGSTGIEYGEKQMTKLVQNDGFDSIDDFFQWFDGDFEGQLIHWTDLTY